MRLLTPSRREELIQSHMEKTGCDYAEAKTWVESQYDDYVEAKFQEHRDRDIDN